MNSEVMKTMERDGLVPVFYNSDVQTSCNAVEACYRGGLRTFEFTNRGEAALEVFKALVTFVKEKCPGMYLGVGSISFGKDARKFIRAGAAFVVGPQFVPQVASVCKWHRVPYVPGCGTVSEVGRAQRAGCRLCKVFPGEVLTPAFVKALMAPMPWSRIMVTGGVKPELSNLESWFKAGATCVGMGSNLFPKEAVAGGDWEKISSICGETLRMIAAVKNLHK